jgi:hypothetical protein
MGVLTTAKGTTQAAWWLSSGTVRLVNNSGVWELQDNAGNTAVVRVAGIPASGETFEDVPNYLDLRGVGALIEFAFSGSAAPTPGDNTAKFGFCHTSGTTFTAGKIYYDDGAALTEQAHIRLIISTAAVTGTVSLSANGIYALEGSTWTVKGDLVANSVFPPVKLSFTHASTTITSTTHIPDTAEITAIRVNVTEAFNGTAPTLAAATNGSSPVNLIVTADFNLKIAEQYNNDTQVVLGTDKGGHIVLTVTSDSSTTGEADVYVYYTIPSA